MFIACGQPPFRSILLLRPGTTRSRDTKILFYGQIQQAVAGFALDYLAAFELPLLRVGKILSARAINPALAEFGSLIEYGENTILSLLFIFFHDVFRNLLFYRRKFQSTARHVKPGRNTGGPPSNPKYYPVTDSV